jgi:23S rRNA (adenine2503-C2)-methyltransferase
LEQNVGRDGRDILLFVSNVNLIGLLPSELEDLAVELGASRYRGRQLATWIYRKSIFDLEAMSDLPKDFRQELAGRAVVEMPELEREMPSADGSRKLVFALNGASRISSVLMPDDERITLCVSTQVGCGFACGFCLTGVMGLERNLTAGEIVSQVLAANRLLEKESRRVTHIVFMGMGEPLANYAAVVKALRILTDAKLGLAYSPRRITVSTVGLVPGIDKLGREDLKVNLAISLHAAVKRYPLASRQRVFFEYVMLEDVNDALDDAQRLARLLRGVKAKVNLIPFNDWEGARFRRPPLARILAFQSVLLDAGITTTVRWSKGEDIGAACGQLRESSAVASPSAS